MSVSNDSTPSSCAIMLTTPPEGQCPVLPSVSSSSSNSSLRNSPLPDDAQNHDDNPDVKKDTFEPPSLATLTAVGLPTSAAANAQSLNELPALLPNDEMNGPHGPISFSVGRKEGNRRRRPPSPLKGFEAYTPNTFQLSASSTSTPGSLASAVPVTPQTLSGEGAWLSADTSSGSTFSPFGDTQREFSDLAKKVKDITRSPQVVNEDTIGHHLLISDIPISVTKEEVQLFISDITPYRALLVRHLDTHGFAILCFHDSRDTMKVYNKLLISSVRFGNTLGPVSLQCTAIPKDLVRAIDGRADDFHEKVWKDSNTCIEVTVKGSVTVAGVKTVLCRMGDLRFFDADPAGTVFRAEFYDSRAATKAKQVLNGAQIGDLQFTVKDTAEGGGDPFFSRPMPQSTATPASTASRYTFASAAYGDKHSGQSSSSPMITPPRNESFRPIGNAWHSTARLGRSFSINYDLPHTQPSSPTVRSTFSRAHSVSAGAADWARITRHNLRDDPRQQNQSQASRWSDPVLLQNMLDQMGSTARAYQQMSVPQSVAPHNPQAIPVENVIHRDRIVNGLDRRTTVMIKDVPNKLSREELVNILRDVVPNEFDFVYLRFDFNNHCNVGYAFVNFTSIQALLTFVEVKAGRKWNLFASEKVLQVSYANIQGKSNLITKFRNSHVMDAPEEWRPQIFYSDGALKGQPELFPESDHSARHHQRGSSRPPFVASPAAINGGGNTAHQHSSRRPAV